MEHDELAAWLRLTLTPGVGNATARKLLHHFGLPQQVFAQSAAALRVCTSAAQSQALQTLPPALQPLLEKTWQWLQSSNADLRKEIAPLGHPLYPAALLNSDDPPLLLYLMGATRFLDAQAPALTMRNCLAVVGSRNPHRAGPRQCPRLCPRAAQQRLNYCVGLGLRH